MTLAMCEVLVPKISEMQGYIVVYNMIIVSLILIVSYVMIIVNRTTVDNANSQSNSLT